MCYLFTEKQIKNRKKFEKKVKEKREKAIRFAMHNSNVNKMKMIKQDLTQNRKGRTKLINGLYMMNGISCYFKFPDGMTGDSMLC